MHPKTAEKIFKSLFFLAVVIFAITSVGIFLLILKVLLLFTPEINIMGLIITQ